MTEPWTPWEPLEDFEGELYALVGPGMALDQLAAEYLSVPELATLAVRPDGTRRPYVEDQCGHPHPRVMLVGEAPGKDEDEVGEPFVGAAGRLLDEELARVGISRRGDCWATNPIKHRPVDSAGKNRKPTDREVELARPTLLREIELIDPLIVVTLGNVPAQAVWPDAPGITSCHGQLRELPTGHAHLLAVHPSYALRDRHGEPMRAFRSDLAKLAELVKATCRRVLVTGSREFDDPPAAREVVRLVLDEELRRHGRIVLVHGACPKGVDAWAAEWAAERRLQVFVEPHPADWSRGLAGGMSRNQAMVDLGADACHAILGPCRKDGCTEPGPHFSHGGRHCADRAEKAGIETFRYPVPMSVAADLLQSQVEGYEFCVLCLSGQHERSVHRAEATPSHLPDVSARGAAGGAR